MGTRNGVNTLSIESKMGIKGSPTCVLNFDNAKGFLIGEENKGLSSMFTMMNLERIIVGIQGRLLRQLIKTLWLMLKKENKVNRTTTKTIKQIL